MFKTFMLRLEGLGCLQSIRQKNGAIIVRIEAINAEQKLQETHGADVCTFECNVSNKFAKLFAYLQELISKEYTVMLSFLANYKDSFICNCCAEDDPNRILHFYAELDKVKCVYVNGVKHSVRDLLYDIKV